MHENATLSHLLGSTLPLCHWFSGRDMEFLYMHVIFLTVWLRSDVYLSLMHKHLSTWLGYYIFETAHKKKRIKLSQTKMGIIVLLTLILFSFQLHPNYSMDKTVSTHMQNKYSCFIRKLYENEKKRKEKSKRKL